MQIDLKAVGNRVVVDSCCQTAGACERVGVEAGAAAIARSSSGVLSDCLPRPPQTWMPSSCARGSGPA